MRKTAIIIFALALSTCSKSPGTLEEVLSTGKLQVVTRNSPTTFYRGADGYEGPEYLLAKGFARHLSEKYGRHVEAEFQTVDRFSELLTAVEDHDAHLAAAALAITPERQTRVAFGPTYQEVKLHLIYRLNSGRPRDYSDLRGKRLEIMAGSSFAETLAEIQDENPGFSWSENPNADISELLFSVDKQEIDYTIADSSTFDVQRHYMPDLAIAMNLKDQEKLAWAFSKTGSEMLIADAAEYFRKIRRNGKLEQIKERYYGHTDRFDYVGTRTFIRHHDRRLGDFEDMFRAAAAETNLDWQLIAAIGYQESHWNPEAVSPTGVRGLMMLTGTTANYMGVDDREDPAESIRAGAHYFARLRERLNDIPEPDRTWFALAAYNVGYSHVRDAQRIIRIQGGNPNRWLELKDALPLLAQRKWHSQVPNGYARGWEPVQYVNNIRTYYEILNWLRVDQDPVKDADQMIAPEKSRLQTASNGDSAAL